MIHFMTDPTWKRLTTDAERAAGLEAEQKSHEETKGELADARTGLAALRQALEGQVTANKTLKQGTAELVAEIIATITGLHRADAGMQVARILLNRVPALGLPELTADSDVTEAALPVDLFVLLKNGRFHSVHTTQADAKKASGCPRDIHWSPGPGYDPDQPPTADWSIFRHTMKASAPDRRAVRAGRPAGHKVPWPDGATHRYFNRAGWPVYVHGNDERPAWKCTGCQDGYHSFRSDAGANVNVDAQRHAEFCTAEPRPTETHKEVTP